MAVVQASAAAKNPGKSQGRDQGQGRKGWVAVVLALALGSAGILVWLGAQRSTGASGGAAAEFSLPLETFVVNVTAANVSGSSNLSGSSQRGYLRIGITLGLAHPLPRNQAEAASTARVRDTILAVLAGAQPDELLTLEGKRQLKNELLKALQERVPQLAVENVYFTEFLVQM
jgi:flagellar basal body-associated protein FliL